jgi:transposase InsO family protein
VRLSKQAASPCRPATRRCAGQDNAQRDLSPLAARLVDRVARELQQAGWRLERALTDNGQEWRSTDVTAALERHQARVTRIRAGRPRSNGHVEALHRPILEECWRRAFARYLHLRFHGLKCELAHYLHLYNTDRVDHGRLTRGRIRADIVHGADKMKPTR